MGRLPRLVADGLVYHAMNRGNNRRTVFRGAADFAGFLEALRKTQTRYPFRLYAYCLMSNHFHLILAPGPGQSISRILQSLTVAHTWRVHRQSGSVGHVWQGRFKSPVVQDDAHLLTVMRYVEANPLRARLVSDLADYRWSSYRVHGLGETDDLVAEAPVWQGLARSVEACQAQWRRWVHTPISAKELASVRKAVVSGRPYGTSAWQTRTARKLGLDLTERPRGRPPKKPGK